MYVSIYIYTISLATFVRRGLTRRGMCENVCTYKCRRVQACVECVYACKNTSSISRHDIFRGVVSNTRRMNNTLHEKSSTNKRYKVRNNLRYSFNERKKERYKV